MEARVYRPMLNANIASRFNQTSTIEGLLSDLFIEQWNAQYSYSAFFNGCNVSYCSYAISERDSLLMIITTLIGMFGGLDVGLRLLLPFVINLLAYCKTKFFSRNQIATEHHDQQPHSIQQGNRRRLQ